MKLHPHDAAYPKTLCHLAMPPTLTLSAPLDPSKRVVAIVGSRKASGIALSFVERLAYFLARADVVVASGGARGVDRAAHEGALRGGGATWCVAPCGRGQIFPPENAELFERLESAASSRMIWPLPDGTPKNEETPRFRNLVLMGLSEAVIVVQAALKSGSRSTISKARELERRIFLVPSVPWDLDYEGTMHEGTRGGVEPVWSIEHVFDKLGLPRPDAHDPNAPSWRNLPHPPKPRRQNNKERRTYGSAPLFPVDRGQWSEDEKLVFSTLCSAPTQQDQIIERVGLPTSSTLTALLTLSLKDVVVEGPDGFFRRRTGV